MPLLIDPEATYIPNDVLGESEAGDRARTWGNNQRKEAAGRWASNWRNALADYSRQIRQPEGEWQGAEWVPTPAPGAEGLAAIGDFLDRSRLLTQGLRQTGGFEQLGRETAAPRARQDELIRRLDAGDRTVLPELQAIEDELNRAYREDPFQAVKRSPELGGLETLGGVAEGLLGFAVAPTLGAGLARNIAGAAIAPGQQIPGMGIEAALGVPGRVARGVGRLAETLPAPRLPEAPAPPPISQREATSRLEEAARGSDARRREIAEAFGVPADPLEEAAARRPMTVEERLEAAYRPREGPGGLVSRDWPPPPGREVPEVPPTVPSRVPPGPAAPGRPPIAPGQRVHLRPVGYFENLDQDTVDYIDDANRLYNANVKRPISNVETVREAVRELALSDDVARQVLARPDGQPAKQITQLRIAVLRAELDYNQAQAMVEMGKKLGDTELEAWAHRMSQAGIRNLELRLAAAQKYGTEAGRALQSLKIAIGYDFAVSGATSAKYAARMMDDAARRIGRGGGRVDEGLLQDWEEIKAWFDANETRIAGWEKLGLLGTRLPEPPPGPIAGGALTEAQKQARRVAQEAAFGERMAERMQPQKGQKAAIARTVNTILRRKGVDVAKVAPDDAKQADELVRVGLPKDPRRVEFLKLARQRSVAMEIGDQRVMGGVTREVMDQADARMQEILDEWKDEYRTKLQNLKPEEFLKFATPEDARRWWDKQFMEATQRQLRGQVAREFAGLKEAGAVGERIAGQFKRNWAKDLDEMAREVGEMEKRAITTTARERLARIDRFIKAGGDRDMARAAIDDLRQLGTGARVASRQYEQALAKQRATAMVGGERWEKLTPQQKQDLVGALASPEFFLNPRAANAFASAMARPSNWDKAHATRLASMLSGPPTQVLNFLGNMMETGLAPAERAIAGGLERRIPMEPGYRSATERMALDEIQGWAASAKLALEEGIITFQTGISSRPLREATSYGTDIVPRSVPTVLGGVFGGAMGWGQAPEEATPEEKARSVALGVLGGTVMGGAMGTKLPKFGVSPLNLILRTMAAGDDFARTLNTSGVIIAEARREALRSGKSLNHIMLNLTDYPQVMERTSRETMARTYQEQLEGIGKIMQAARTQNSTIQTIVPFWQTIANMAVRGMERTPMGFLKSRRLAGEGDYARAADVRARAVLGSTIMGLAGIFASTGDITGYGPSDPRERADWLDQGNQPYSIKVGGEWRSYAGMGSLIVPLGIAASAVDAMREFTKPGETKLDDRVGRGLVAAVRSFGSLWLNVLALKGLSDVVNAITDPDRYGPKLVESLGVSFQPGGGFLASVARAFDPEVKDPEDFFEALAARYPGFSGTVKPRLTQLGEPVERSTTGPLAAVLPIRGMRERPEPVLREYERLRGQGFEIAIGRTDTKSVEGLPLTLPERAEYARKVGQAIKTDLAKLIAKPAYQRQSPEVQARLLTETESDIRDEASARYEAELVRRLGREGVRARLEEARRQRVKQGRAP